MGRRGREELRVVPIDDRNETLAETVTNELTLELVPFGHEVKYEHRCPICRIFLCPLLSRVPPLLRASSSRFL